MNTPTNDEPLPTDLRMTLFFLDELSERLSCLDNNILFTTNYLSLLRTIRDYVLHELDRFTENPK